MIWEIDLVFFSNLFFSFKIRFKIIISVINLTFLTVSGSDDNISAHSWVGDLADDIPVGGSNDQSVFWGVEFVLVLGAKSSSCLVIGFTFLSPLEFRLESLEVSFVFLDLNQSINSLLSSVSVLSGHFKRLLMPQLYLKGGSWLALKIGVFT